MWSRCSSLKATGAGSSGNCPQSQVELMSRGKGKDRWRGEFFLRDEEGCSGVRWSMNGDPGCDPGQIT